MAERLELPHLVDQHRVSQVQVGRRGIEAGLDPQRPAAGQPLAQFVLEQDFLRAAANACQLLVDLAHRPIIHRPSAAASIPESTAARYARCPRPKSQIAISLIDPVH